MSAATDRIERKVLLKASRARVWRALSSPKEFGDWFGVSLEGSSMIVGDYLQGHMTHPGYEHVIFGMWIERVVPQRLLSWRWHPYAIDASVDYSAEPTTRVVFELADAEGGTLLSLVESGFDEIPAARRLQAFRMHTQGWDAQMRNIENHVAAP
jgi:uncharacterized protein YndB with AHSA1/START domain